jgi:hypothetical protein
VEERPSVHVGHDVDVVHLDGGAARGGLAGQAELGDGGALGDEGGAKGGKMKSIRLLTADSIVFFCSAHH